MTTLKKFKVLVKLPLLHKATSTEINLNKKNSAMEFESISMSHIAKFKNTSLLKFKSTNKIGILKKSTDPIIKIISKDF